MLFASHIGHKLSEKKKRKRKMWSKKWYLKRNISCGAHLLNELLETDVEDYVNYLRMNEQTKRTVLRPALLPVKTAQFTQFFRQA